MTLVDWVIVIAIALSVLQAAANGFLSEVFSFAGVVLGFLAAAWEYPRVAAWYEPLVKTPSMANIAGFLTIFFAIVVLAGIIGRISRWAAKEAGLGWADRLLGGAFGLARGTLFVTVVLMAAASFAPNAGWLRNSQIAPYLMVVGRAASWAAPGELRGRFRDGMNAVRDMRNGRGKEQAVRTR